MTDMPVTYETKTSSDVEGGAPQSNTTGCYTGYIKTIPGILKIVEMVLDMIMLICCICMYSGGGGWGSFLAGSALFTTALIFIFHLTNLINRLPGPWLIIAIDLIMIICCCLMWGAAGGWGVFLAASAIITTGVLFVFHITNLISRLPGPWLVIEFAYFVIYAALYFITAIICAAYAGKGGIGAGASGAGAFFGFAATGVYAVDAFLMFRTWRAAGSPTGRTETQQASTTTTVTTVETTQY